MQAINVFVVLSLDYLFVTITRKWIICQCFTLFDDQPLTFWRQRADELKRLLLDNQLVCLPRKLHKLAFFLNSFPNV